MDQQLVDAIRTAFASGQFAKAQRLWSRHAGQLQHRIAAGTATAETLGETRELIDWSALVVKVHQAHAASQLMTLSLAGRYQSPPPDPPAAVRVRF